MSTTDSTPQVNNEQNADQEPEFIPQSNPDTMDISFDLVDKEATSIVDKAGEPECVKVTHDLHAQDQASTSPKKDEHSTLTEVDQLIMKKGDDTPPKEDEGSPKEDGDSTPKTVDHFILQKVDVTPPKEDEGSPRRDEDATPRKVDQFILKKVDITPPKEDEGSPREDENATPKKVDQFILKEAEDTTSNENEGTSKKEEEAVISSSLPTDVEDVKIDLDAANIESKPEQEDKPKEEEGKPKEEETKGPSVEEEKIEVEEEKMEVEEEKMEVDGETTEAKEGEAGKESTPVAAESGPKKRSRKAAKSKTPATPALDSIASSRPRRTGVKQVNYFGTSDAAAKATLPKKRKQTKRKATSDSEDDGESHFEDKPSTKKGKTTKSIKKGDDVEVMPVSRKRAAPTTSAALNSTPKGRGRPPAKKSKTDSSPAPENEELPASSSVAPTVAE